MLPKGTCLILAMPKTGSIFLSWIHKEGFFAGAPRIFEFHHSSFLAGGKVAAAGEMDVASGMLLMHDNNTGHYKPTNEHNDQFAQELSERGIDGRKTRRSVT